ncbi:hypothetical protein P7K49_035353 [Saguinus oedipus]|uniref:Uncharacterized protein n=1 Tax=Saguinus oedipus TaxID=9490 RepID=A0ABQ9TNC7_SAGOE|nr:hypothetical protein P7K49_035353 [Saguinus oedipus]
MEQQLLGKNGVEGGADYRKYEVKGKRKRFIVKARTRKMWFLSRHCLRSATKSLTGGLGLTGWGSFIKHRLPKLSPDSFMYDIPGDTTMQSQALASSRFLPVFVSG